MSDETRIGYGEEAALREQLRESEMRVLKLKAELSGADEVLSKERAWSKTWQDVAAYHERQCGLAMHFGRELAEAYGELPRLVGIPECISIGGGGAPE